MRSYIAQSLMNLQYISDYDRHNFSNTVFIELNVSELHIGNVKCVINRIDEECYNGYKIALSNIMANNEN